MHELLLFTRLGNILQKVSLSDGFKGNALIYHMTNNCEFIFQVDDLNCHYTLIAINTT